MIDAALERNRRTAWARFYDQRDRLKATRLRQAELAVWLMELSENLPLEAVYAVEEALSHHEDHVVDGIRRYVRHARSKIPYGRDPEWWKHPVSSGNG